jgi:hypothetical protein
MLARANGSTLGHVLLGSLILFSTSTEAMYGTSKGCVISHAVMTRVSARRDPDAVLVDTHFARAFVSVKR